MGSLEATPLSNMSIKMTLKSLIKELIENVLIIRECMLITKEEGLKIIGNHDF